MIEERTPPHQPLDRRQVLVLLGFLLLTFAAAAIGSLFTTGGLDPWYRQLEKPALNPPSWVFGPVWTLLYILMATAAWLVWRRGDWGRARLALGLWVVQLALNSFWSILFFGMRAPGPAFVELVVLWLAILATTIAFARWSRPAALLMLPYLAWVTFAGYLNFSIWLLN